MAPRIANFAEWARHVLHGLEAELARRPADAGGTRWPSLHAELTGYVPPYRPGPGHLGFAVPLELRTAAASCWPDHHDHQLRHRGRRHRLRARLEAFLPADAATAAALRRMRVPS